LCVFSEEEVYKTTIARLIMIDTAAGSEQMKMEKKGNMIACDAVMYLYLLSI
jgi:hypothetical protein